MSLQAAGVPPAAALPPGAVDAVPPELHEVVRLDVPAADHRRKPPERLVLGPQPLELAGIPPLFDRCH